MSYNLQIAQNALLIRKPTEMVFQVFVNPEITSKFWFTKSSGKLEAGKVIEWTWEMYQFKIPVKVISIIENKQIVIEWGNYEENSMVEFLFDSISESQTFVSIKNYDFKGDEATITKQCLDSTEGFALVLAGLKAFLEFDIELNLVADRFPKTT